MSASIMTLCTLNIQKSFRRLLKSNWCTFSRYSTVRKSVESVLSTVTDNKVQKIEGWLKAVRKHKDTIFLHLSDGSSMQSLQVVCDPNILNNDVTYGSCVSVEGRLVKSKHSGQEVELIAEKLTVLGECDPVEYPFKARKRHPLDYTRSYPHLRPRTNLMTALLRIRNTATITVHNFFQKHGYCFIHTPILTSSDCEGAGEVFQIEPSSLTPSHTSDDKESEKYFFGKPAYLTVSGQLHLETVASALSKVYNFGPTFRAENSRGRHHLSEFYMIEAEVAFIEKLDDLMEIMEDLLKTTGQHLLELADVKFYHQHITEPSHLEVVEKSLSKKFERMSYTEAVHQLEINNPSFQFKVSWGCDFQKEHEKYLTHIVGGIPVFITDFPASIKPFYAKMNSDDKTVAAVDLLVPSVGELIGGTLREHRFSVLDSKLDSIQKRENYDWYLDLRKFGSAPHGGFGMGFERYLQFLLGVSNIRDVIPFPRSPSNCKL
ncbi:probable asparagine--tRNA ligase, mitochondrial [Gigantopelta aegis]|uniref:probable asparagine--tRNA ligase, mitochondrial n=1 Tax=Gigantopelta aegis TaxID=1735272 RepID=UPI001B88D4FF|nr:probable asparagine--tRNA ligase, mitochondrial [Gigantopelta aegis]